jgi:hypothetical protein
MRKVLLALVLFAAPASAESARPQSLKVWMNANASMALKTSNYDKLKAAFDSVKSFAPTDPQFASWQSIAARGAEAARNHDLDAVREACKSCHDAHRAAYREWVHGR